MSIELLQVKKTHRGKVTGCQESTHIHIEITHDNCRKVNLLDPLSCQCQQGIVEVLGTRVRGSEAINGDDLHLPLINNHVHEAKVHARFNRFGTTSKSHREQTKVGTACCFSTQADLLVLTSPQRGSWGREG